MAVIKFDYHKTSVLTGLTTSLNEIKTAIATPLSRYLFESEEVDYPKQIGKAVELLLKSKRQKVIIVIANNRFHLKHNFEDIHIGTIVMSNVDENEKKEIIKRNNPTIIFLPTKTEAVRFLNKLKFIEMKLTLDEDKTDTFSHVFKLETARDFKLVEVYTIHDDWIKIGSSNNACIFCKNIFPGVDCITIRARIQYLDDCFSDFTDIQTFSVPERYRVIKSVDSNLPPIAPIVIGDDQIVFRISSKLSFNKIKIECAKEGDDVWTLVGTSHNDMVSCKKLTPNTTYEFRAQIIYSDEKRSSYIKTTVTTAFMESDTTIKLFSDVAALQKINSDMFDSIRTFRLPPYIISNGVTQINILLTGFIRQGKSCFYNSINSLYNGRFYRLQITYSDMRSVTKKLKKATIACGENIRIWDTFGLDDSYTEGGDITNLHDDEIVKMLSGAIKDKCPNKPLDQQKIEDKWLTESTTLNDRVHAVAIVISMDRLICNDPSVIKSNEHLFEKFNSLCEKNGLQPLIIITKIDEYGCPQGNFKDMYMSTSLKKAIEKASVFSKGIFPVINYTIERQFRTQEYDRLLLNSFDALYKSGLDYIKKEILEKIIIFKNVKTKEKLFTLQVEDSLENKINFFREKYKDQLSLLMFYNNDEKSLADTSATFAEIVVQSSEQRSIYVLSQSQLPKIVIKINETKIGFVNMNPNDTISTLHNTISDYKIYPGEFSLLSTNGNMLVHSNDPISKCLRYDKYSPYVSIQPLECTSVDICDQLGKKLATIQAISKSLAIIEVRKIIEEKIKIKEFIFLTWDEKDPIALLQESIFTAEYILCFKGEITEITLKIAN